MPPMPQTRIRATMHMLRGWVRSSPARTRVLSPTTVMAPKSRSMMPPITGTGMVCSRAPILPIKARATAENGGPGHDGGVKGPGQGDGAGDFRIGGVGRPAQQGRHGRGQAVAEHGPVNARILDEVFSGDAADGENVAKMFDGRCDGHRHDEEDRLKVEFRKDKFWDGKPGGFGQDLEIDQRGSGEILQAARIKGGLGRGGHADAVQDQGGQVTGGHADENGG